jgi:hypothetical protein
MFKTLAFNGGTVHNPDRAGRFIQETVPCLGWDTQW